MTIHTALYIEKGDPKMATFNNTDLCEFTRGSVYTKSGMFGIFSADLRGIPFWFPDWYIPEAGYSAELPNHPGWWNNGAVDIWVRPEFPEPVAVVNGADFCKVSGLTRMGWRPGRRGSNRPAEAESQSGPTPS